ncbi:nucleotidyltransferase domain-containing protein [bacterium]|nr:nucleotidyltransferase domain-containing protein [bacterium]
MVERTEPDVLTEIVARLVDEFQPDTIYLFGSHAWGEPHRDSDLDILVVVPDSDETPAKRAQRAYARKAGLMVPMDIVVQTREEFERFLPAASSLAHRIVRDGKVLYARPA